MVEQFVIQAGVTRCGCGVVKSHIGPSVILSMAFWYGHSVCPNIGVVYGLSAVQGLIAIAGLADRLGSQFGWLLYLGAEGYNSDQPGVAERIAS